MKIGSDLNNPFILTGIPNNNQEVSGSAVRATGQLYLPKMLILLDAYIVLNALVLKM